MTSYQKIFVLEPLVSTQDKRPLQLGSWKIVYKPTRWKRTLRMWIEYFHHSVLGAHLSFPNLEMGYWVEMDLSSLLCGNGSVWQLESMGKSRHRVQCEKITAENSNPVFIIALCVSSSLLDISGFFRQGITGILLRLILQGSGRTLHVRAVLLDQTKGPPSAADCFLY